MTFNRKEEITSATPRRSRGFQITRMPRAVLAVIAVMTSPWLPVDSFVHATHTDPAYLASIALNAGSGYFATGGHEAAVNTVTNRIYVAGGRTGTVSVVDGATRSVIAEVPVGSNAIRVAVNEETNRIYAANWQVVSWPCCSTVAVIDGDSNAVIANVVVNGHPWGLVVNPTTNRVYVANWINVQVIDGATNTIVTSFGAGSNELAAGLNPVTERLYIGATFLGNGQVNVFDTASNAFVGSFAVDGSAQHIRVNTRTNKLYVTQGAPGPAFPLDSLLVVDGVTNTVTGRVTLPGGVHDVAIDEGVNRVYAAWSSAVGGITVIDGTTDAVVVFPASAVSRV